MSFENAILVHAAALEKLAVAIKSAFGNGVILEAAQITGTPGNDAGYPTDAQPAAVKAGVKPDAELDADVAKIEADAAQAKAMASVEEKKAAAKAKADAKAKKDAEDAASSAAASQTAGAGSSDDLVDGLDDAPLDYVKDVRPVLLAAIKKAGKDKVQALVASFGVEKADKVEPSKYAELLAGAQKLAA